MIAAALLCGLAFSAAAARGTKGSMAAIFRASSRFNRSNDATPLAPFRTDLG